MKEAMFYRKYDENSILCILCPHNCVIKDGHRGACRVRKNENGKLYTLNYNKISALALDPIEKKPLYHFYPGSYILSAGTIGCNLKCSFCQNWEIAHKQADTRDITPEELIRIAEDQADNIGIAYTYNEPSIWYEFVYECSKLSKEKGLKNVLVTNGFINIEPLEKLLPLIDGMNIDVKGFTEKYYREICKGLLEPVKKTVEKASGKCHIEITTLVVTDLNDSIEEIGQIASWLSSIDKNIPLHLSRYFPNYELSNNATPISRLEAVRDEAKKYLNYVYVGNAWGLDSTTYCPKCKNVLIKRGTSVSTEGIVNGKCMFCGEKIYLLY